MSHCYSVGVKLNGEEKEICTIVPGNEDLGKHVRESETNGTKPRKPTDEEVNRAIDYHIGQHKETDHPESDLNDMNKLKE